MNKANSRQRRQQAHESGEKEGDINVSGRTMAKACERCSVKDDKEIDMEKKDRKATLRHASWERGIGYISSSIRLTMLVFGLFAMGFALYQLFTNGLHGLHALRCSPCPPCPPTNLANVPTSIVPTILNMAEIEERIAELTRLQDLLLLSNRNLPA
ncbi:hypothetical protein V492_04433 [Pseudogymnoascus sp. VKM F-4246]|nr:hypothetical protein V492_04433 [Pseudogymnoascus sp. VKM F-4246]